MDPYTKIFMLIRESVSTGKFSLRDGVKIMSKKSAQPYKVEIINDVLSVSLSYDPVKLTTLLMRVARYDEIRKHLMRKRPDKMVYLLGSVIGAKIEETHDRFHTEYQIRLQKGDDALEYVPIREWSYLIPRLGLFIQKDSTQLKREALKAAKYFKAHAVQKLGYSLMQYLFEALHAATGSPVSEGKRKELEKIGSMVDKSWELRLAGRNSPAGLRRDDKRHLEELIKLSLLILRQRKQTITYDAVAEHLQSEFEYDPVLTGETLRKAVSHHGLNWMKMKKRKT